MGSKQSAYCSLWGPEQHILHSARQKHTQTTYHHQGPSSKRDQCSETACITVTSCTPSVAKVLFSESLNNYRTHYRGTTCLAMLPGAFLKQGKPSNPLSSSIAHSALRRPDSSFSSWLQLKYNEVMFWMTPMNRAVFQCVRKTQPTFSSPQNCFHIFLLAWERRKKL